MRGMADGPVQMVKMWAKPCAMGAIYFPAWPTHGPTYLLDRRQAVPHDRREHLRQERELALREGERVRHELAHRCRHLQAELFVCLCAACRAALHVCMRHLVCAVPRGLAASSLCTCACAQG